MISEAAVRERLWADEELLWVGRPRRGLHLLPGDALVIPFLAVWCGFLVVWIAAAVRSGQVAFTLVGVGMLGIGASVIAGPRWEAHRRSTDTLYAVTTRRVMSVAERSATFELPIEGLSLSVLRSGPGATIAFAANVSSSAFAGFGVRRSADGWPPPAFVDIEDGVGLLRALDRARSGARPSGGPTAAPSD